MESGGVTAYRTFCLFFLPDVRGSSDRGVHSVIVTCAASIQGSDLPSLALVDSPELTNLFSSSIAIH